DRAAALGVEVAGQALDEVFLAFLDDAAETLGERPDLPLELGPDVVDVGCGPLGLDQAGPDLDGPDARPGRGPVLLGLPSHPPSRAGVMNFEMLDYEPIVDDPNRLGAVV